MNAPCILLPVCNGVEALDGVLLRLDQTVPARTRVLIGDDASSDTRVETLVRSWCHRTRLQASFEKHAERRGWVRLVQALWDECDGDAVLLDQGALLPKSWWTRLRACAEADERLACVQPWSDVSQSCCELRGTEHGLFEAGVERLSDAAQSLATQSTPDVPPGFSPVMFLREEARRALGGLDVGTFETLHAAIADWCERALAMGWRNGLCLTWFAGSHAQAPIRAGIGLASDDMRRLLARWPQHNETLAQWLLQDPLRGARRQLAEALAENKHSGPQADLFA